MMFAGTKVAFSVLSLFDGYGRKAPPSHAAGLLLNSILEELVQDGPTVYSGHSPSPHSMAYSLQTAFTQALPQVRTFPSSYLSDTHCQLQCIAFFAVIQSPQTAPVCLQSFCKSFMDTLHWATGVT